MRLINNQELFSVGGGDIGLASQYGLDLQSAYYGEMGDPISGDNSYFNGFLGGTFARVSGAAGAAFIDGVIVGAEIGTAGGPATILGGIVIGGAAGYLAYKLLK